MHRQSLVVLSVLCAFSLAALPPALEAQAGAPQSHAAQSQAADPPLLANERDVAARNEALLKESLRSLSNESTDLEEMAKSLRGIEMDTALALDQRAIQGVMELDAVLWFFAVYDNMQCEPDREVAKAALKNRLGSYSHLLGLEADQAAGYLAYTRLPAIAQAGARIKDDLRAAQHKMDEVAASLK